MSKKLPLVMVFALLGMVLFSCKKTYVCQCIRYNGTTMTSYSNYDLLETNRKNATYTCKRRNLKSKTTAISAECKLIN